MLRLLESFVNGGVGTWLCFHLVPVQGEPFMVFSWHIVPSDYHILYSGVKLM